MREGGGRILARTMIAALGFCLCAAESRGAEEVDEFTVIGKDRSAPSAAIEPDTRLILPAIQIQRDTAGDPSPAADVEKYHEARTARPPEELRAKKKPDITPGKTFLNVGMLVVLTAVILALL